MNELNAEKAWEELSKSGAVYIPGFLNAEETKQAQQSANELYEKLPYGYVYGVEGYDSFNPQRRETEPPLTNVQVMPIFDSAFEDPRLLDIIFKKSSHDLLTRLLGDDYYLMNAIVHTIRPGTGRLPYHKDSHGQAVLVILIDDLTEDCGGTAAIPGTHINSPPPSCCMRDVCQKQSGEIQTVGRAGDAYIMSLDVWHGRSDNLSERPLRKMMIHFNTRNTVTCPPFVKRRTPESMIEIQGQVADFARPLVTETDEQVRQRADGIAQLSWLKTWACNLSNGTNQLFRSFVHQYINGGSKPMADGRGHIMSIDTTSILLNAPFRTLTFLGHLNPRAIIRMSVGVILRAIPGGARAIQFVRGLRGSS